MRSRMWGCLCSEFASYDIRRYSGRFLASLAELRVTVSGVRVPVWLRDSVAPLPASPADSVPLLPPSSLPRPLLRSPQFLRINA